MGSQPRAVLEYAVNCLIFERGFHTRDAGEGKVSVSRRLRLPGTIEGGGEAVIERLAAAGFEVCDDPAGHGSQAVWNAVAGPVRLKIQYAPDESPRHVLIATDGDFRVLDPDEALADFDEERSRVSSIIARVADDFQDVERLVISTLGTASEDETAQKPRQRPIKGAPQRGYLRQRGTKT